MDFDLSTGRLAQERGTCSIFCVMGRIRRAQSGRRVMTVCWTYDERIEDGLYSYITIAGIQERIEDPARNDRPEPWR